MSLLFSSARSVEEAREVSSPFTRPSKATLTSVFDDRMIATGRYWVARYWVAQLEGSTSALAARPGAVQYPFLAFLSLHYHFLAGQWALTSRIQNFSFFEEKKLFLTPGRIFFRAVGESKTWDDRPYMYFINSFFWKVFSHIKTAPLFVTWNQARLGSHLLCQPCWVRDYVMFTLFCDFILFCGQ